MKFDYAKIFGIAFSLLFLFLFINSFLDYFRIKSDVSKLSHKIYNLRSQKYFLSKNIEKFIGPEIDFDLLETQMRNILALVNENETIIFWKDFPGENLNVYYGRS